MVLSRNAVPHGGEAALQAAEFAKRDVKLLALSCDSVEDHAGWIKDIASARGANVDYPIISDAKRDTAVLLGMLDEEEKDAAGIPATGSLDVPSAARYPTKAAGSIPSFRKCRSEMEPKRFDSAPPSASVSSGKCPKVSAFCLPPSASKISI